MLRKVQTITALVILAALSVVGTAWLSVIVPFGGLIIATHRWPSFQERTAANFSSATDYPVMAGVRRVSRDNLDRESASGESVWDWQLSQPVIDRAALQSPCDVPSWSPWRGSNRAVDGDVVEDVRGWPFPALGCYWRRPAECTATVDFTLTGGISGGPTTSRIPEFHAPLLNELRALPALVRWPEFMADFTVWLAIWSAVLLLLGIPTWARRGWWRRYVRCAACGHDVRVARDARCPECGDHFGRRTSICTTGRIALLYLIAVLMLAAEIAGAVMFAQSAIGPELIHTAAMTGDIETLTAEVGHTDVNTPLDAPNVSELDGATPLICAVYRGREEAMAFLIQHGADLDATGADGRTALNWAVRLGHSALARRLLLAGADPDIAAGDKTTALTLAIHGDNEIVLDALIATGADLTLGQWGMSPLGWAARYGHTQIVAKLLDAGVEINDGGNWTSLARAVAHGHIDMARFLLDRGADVNAQGIGGAMAILVAPTGGPDAVRLLLEAGADVSVTYPSGATPLHVCCVLDQPDVAITAQLLLDAGVDLNAVDADGLTPLLLAIRYDRFEFARWAIDAGADVSIRNPDGESAIDLIEGKAPGIVPWRDLLRVIESR